MALKVTTLDRLTEYESYLKDKFISEDEQKTLITDVINENILNIDYDTSGLIFDIKDTSGVKPT